MELMTAFDRAGSLRWKSFNCGLGGHEEFGSGRLETGSPAPNRKVVVTDSRGKHDHTCGQNTLRTLT
jgi:hypothetical protein